MSQDSPAHNQAGPAGAGDDDAAYDYDILVVGSGFGGAVSALRLSEKGYRVGVLEAGRAVQPRHPAQELLGPEELPLGSRPRPLRHPAGAPARQGDGAGRCGGGWRLAELRQHAVRAPGAVLRGPAVGAHHGLAGRAEAVLRPGHADARGPAQPDDDPLGRPPQGGRRGHGCRRHLPSRPRRRLLRRRQGRRRHGEGQARRHGRRPVLRRCGPRPQGLHGVRRMHDGLPATVRRTPSTRTTSTSPRRPERSSTR